MTPEQIYERIKAMSPLFCWTGTLEPLGFSKEQAEKVGLFVQCYAQQMYATGVLCALEGIVSCDAKTAAEILGNAKQAVELCGKEIGIDASFDVKEGLK